MRLQVYMKYVYMAAGVALFIPVLFHLDRHPDKNGGGGGDLWLKV